MRHTTTRRDVLAAGAAGAAAMLTGAWGRLARAAPEREISVKPAVVVLFLRGGQDHLNTLVPHSEGRYRDLRPTIAIPEPGQPNGALDLDGTLGLHPALQGFKRLYDDGLLAPIPCVGSAHPSRSHFDCQDFMEYGVPGDKSIHTGWLNRYLQATGGAHAEEVALRALAMQGRLPRSLRGDYPVLAVPERLGFAARRREGDDVLDLFDPVYAPGDEMMGEREDDPGADALAKSGHDTIRILRRLESILGERPSGEEVVYPAASGRLGQQLKKTARVLKAGQGLEVVGIDWNGWDHHINEGGPAAQDRIWQMLAQLDAAVTAFFEDVRHMRSKVVMLVMTEFGRTNAENGNRGTDHGHGSAMFVIGGKVKGGTVHGEWTTLAPAKTFQNRDLVATTDFRAVMSDVLYDHLGLHASRRIFPGYDRGGGMGLFA